MECFKITGSRGSAWAYIQMRIYIFPALTATNAKRLCEGGLIVFVWIVFAVRLCSGAVGLLPSQSITDTKLNLRCQQMCS